jgi:hypothetical protein
MTDDELRGLIRAAIQRHLGSSASAPAQPSELRRDAASGRGAEGMVSISFAQYPIERTDTMCIIEPAVQCNHCGFCKCHGH